MERNRMELSVKTREMAAEMNDLMSSFIKPGIAAMPNVTDLFDMDPALLEVIKKSTYVYSLYLDVMNEYAEQADRMERKLDMILEAMKAEKEMLCAMKAKKEES